MVKNDDMMSIDDVKNILGIPLLGVIPDSEKIIIASNQGEPIVLDTKNSSQLVVTDCFRGLVSRKWMLHLACGCYT